MILLNTLSRQEKEGDMQNPNNSTLAPLHSFFDNEWRRIGKRFGTTDIDEADFLLYNVWLIDTLYEMSRDVKAPEDFIDFVYDSVKVHLQGKGASIAAGDIEAITDTIFDVQYYIWGLILRGSESLSVDVVGVVSMLDKCIGKRRQDSVTFADSFRGNDVEALRRWLISYIECEAALTTKDEIGWNTEIITGEDIALVSTHQGKGQNQTVINFNKGVNLNSMNITGNAQIGTLIGKAEKVISNNGE